MLLCTMRIPESRSSFLRYCVHPREGLHVRSTPSCSSQRSRLPCVQGYTWSLESPVADSIVTRHIR
jgi:hypothetical protein